MVETRKIGPEVAGWTPAAWPSDGPMEGRYARLERLDADLHAADLFALGQLAAEPLCQRLKGTSNNAGFDA
mgnify:CR=1 FL=1